jgi:hypothetical protein
MNLRTIRFSVGLGLSLSVAWLALLGVSLIGAPGLAAVPAQAAGPAALPVASGLTAPQAFSTTVCGSIITDTTWALASSPYVVCSGDIVPGVTVPAGIRLTIEQGVVVKFNGGASGLYVDGTLIARGTISDPVVFTALSDDAHGGDTNGDITATVPYAGYWGYIGFNAGSQGSILEHVWVGYGGFGHWFYGSGSEVSVNTNDVVIRDSTFAWTGGGNRSGIVVNHASPTIEGNEIRENVGLGLKFNGFDASRPMTLTNNTFISNTNWAVALYLSDETVNVTLQGNTALGNPGNGCWVNGTMSGTATYQADASISKFPFYFESVTVQPSATLQLAAGALIKMGQIEVKGRLLAQGTEESPIVFTSLRDDARGGDTNNDGAAITPGRGDWGNIYFGPTSAGSIMDYVLATYGGYSSAMIEVRTSQFTMTHSWAGNSYWSGLQIVGVTPTIRYNQFFNNSSGVHVVGEYGLSGQTNPLLEYNAFYGNTTGVYINDAQPVVRNNAFYNNYQGIYIPSSDWATAVDARENWWGDAGGPTTSYDGGYNTVGKGDPIYYGWAINFRPWLEYPPPGTVDTADVSLSLLASGSSGAGGPATYNIYYGNYRQMGFASPSATQAAVQYDPTVLDAVLMVVLPQEAEYQEASAGAIYWPARHTVFWRLGDLPYGGSGSLFVRVRFMWGLPEGKRYVAMVRFGGSNIANGAFDVAPFLAYKVETITGMTTLSRAVIDAERVSYPTLGTLYQQALADGYLYGGHFLYQMSTGSSLTQTIMIKSDRTSFRMLRNSGDEIRAYEILRDGYRIFDANGGAAYSTETGGVTLWGDLVAASGTSAVAPAAGCNRGSCFRNCQVENLASCTVGYFANAAGAILGGFQCLEQMDAAGCAIAAANLSPGVGCVVGAGKCIADCGDASTHCCTAAKVERSVWSGIGVDVCATTPCNTVTGIWGLAASRTFCAFGQVCVPGPAGAGGCKNCTTGTQQVASSAPNFWAGMPTRASKEAGNPCAGAAADPNVKCDSTRISVAKDPNAKYGPEGDLLPGQIVTYTLTYENEGAGIAYGVFIADPLSEYFDLTTIRSAGSITPVLVTDTRTLYWLVNEVAPKGQPGSTGIVTFSIRLNDGLPGGTQIINQATVYFPSVPEKTPTNPVVNLIRPLSAVPRSVTTDAGQPVSFTLQGVDVGGASLTYSLVISPVKGALSGALPNLTYTPITGFVGADYLTFKVSNGVTESQPADVSIFVNPWAGDTVPPQVSWTSPASREYVSATLATAVFTDAVGAAYPPVLTIQFSEPISAATVSTGTISVAKQNGAPVSITVEYQGFSSQAVVFLRQPLAQDLYVVTVTTGIKDLIGNPMAANFTWSFATRPPSMVYLPLVLRQ